MSKTVRVIRAKPGLLTPINGVGFAPHPRGSISEEIAADVADIFLRSSGYVLDGDADGKENAAVEKSAVVDAPIAPPVQETPTKPSTGGKSSRKSSVRSAPAPVAEPVQSGEPPDSGADVF